MSLLRPRRQAAQDAVAKMRDIFEWEQLPESSRRFRECAAQIDAELRAEVQQKSVLVSDLDPDEGCEDSVEEDGVTNEAQCGDGGEEFFDAPEYSDPEDVDFVVQDTQIFAVDTDYLPSKDEEEEEDEKEEEAQDEEEEFEEEEDEEEQDEEEQYEEPARQQTSAGCSKTSGSCGRPRDECRTATRRLSSCAIARPSRLRRQVRRGLR
jgi:hypothetical protein